MCTKLGEFIGAWLSLFHLGWQTKFRMNGRYWKWRDETAFGGGGRDVRGSAKLKSIFHYGRWVWRMGRYR